VKRERERERKQSTSKSCKACHAIPPAVAKSIQEIPRAPRVSNLPCPERKTRKKNNCRNEALQENRYKLCLTTSIKTNSIVYLAIYA
jgi:hypothetical protein